MSDILSLLESFLKLISTIISSGFSIKKIKENIDFSNENNVFLIAIISGFFLGLFWSYIRK